MKRHPIIVQSGVACGLASVAVRHKRVRSIRCVDTKTFAYVVIYVRLGEYIILCRCCRSETLIYKNVLCTELSIVRGIVS